jgi:hypothetical protein
MPKASRSNIRFATMGIDELAVGPLSNGINGKISPAKIFGQCHSGVGVHNETLMARTSLSLGSCQGIFFLAVWVQKDGEIFADLGETSV